MLTLVHADSPSPFETIHTDVQVRGIKLLVRRLIGRERLDAEEDRAAVARPTLRLLCQLAESAGELLVDSATP